MAACLDSIQGVCTHVGTVHRVGTVRWQGMRILVVYFSRNGHTARMAKEIARRCGGDLEAIQEMHAGDGIWARWRERWQSLVQASPQIRHPQHNPARYELLIIGSPSLRLGIAPAVRAYILRYRDRFRHVAFFCAEGSGVDQRVFATLERLCGRKPAATFSVARKGLPPAAHREGLTDFMNEIGPQ